MHTDAEPQLLPEVRPDAEGWAGQGGSRLAGSGVGKPNMDMKGAMTMALCLEEAVPPKGLRCRWISSKLAEVSERGQDTSTTPC